MACTSDWFPILTALFPSIVSFWTGVVLWLPSSLPFTCSGVSVLRTNSVLHYQGIHLSPLSCPVPSTFLPCLCLMRRLLLLLLPCRCRDDCRESQQRRHFLLPDQLAHLDATRLDPEAGGQRKGRPEEERVHRERRDDQRAEEGTRWEI